MSQGVFGHTRTLPDTTVLPLSAPALHTTHTHITGESIHIPSAECRLKESMGDNVSYSTQRLKELSLLRASPHPPLSLSLQLLLHGVTHHLAVLLVEGVGATHAGVLLEV